MEAGVGLSCPLLLVGENGVALRCLTRTGRRKSGSALQFTPPLVTYYRWGAPLDAMRPPQVTLIIDRREQCWQRAVGRHKDKVGPGKRRGTSLGTHGDKTRAEAASGSLRRLLAMWLGLRALLVRGRAWCGSACLRVDSAAVRSRLSLMAGHTRGLKSALRRWDHRRAPWRGMANDAWYQAARGWRRLWGTGFLVAVPIPRGRDGKGGKPFVACGADGTSVGLWKAWPSREVAVARRRGVRAASPAGERRRTSALSGGSVGRDPSRH